MSWGRIFVMIAFAGVSILSFAAGFSEMGFFFIIAIAVVAFSMMKRKK